MFNLFLKIMQKAYFLQMMATSIIGPNPLVVLLFADVQLSVVKMREVRLRVVE